MDVLRFVPLAFLCAAALTALLIIADIVLHGRQRMAIMNVAWPVTALYFGPLALQPYWCWARPNALTRHSQPAAAPAQQVSAGHAGGRPRSAAQPTGDDSLQVNQRPPERPYGQTVAVAVTHCGGGCTLGDIAAEWIVLGSAITIAGLAPWPEYILDYCFAYLLGIVYQYFSIVPMRQLKPLPGGVGGHESRYPVAHRV